MPTTNNQAQNLPWYVTSASLTAFISHSLKEDIGAGDYSTLACIPSDSQKKARLLAKSNGVVAGVLLAKAILLQYDDKLEVTILREDGEAYKTGDILLTVSGSARSILSCERLLLNCVQRMSGIATHVEGVVSLVKEHQVKLLDTRKTTPGFRMCEKWAVQIGGGTNHRFGLYDAIMLKDNHIDYNGGVAGAVTTAKKYNEKNNLNLPIIVEVRDRTELKELLNCQGVQRVLLDNMKPDEVKHCVEMVEKKMETEASGGINRDNLVSYAATGVNFISMGNLIYGAPVLDFSLKAYL